MLIIHQGESFVQQVARYEVVNNLPICCVWVVSLVFAISREFFSVHRLNYLAPYASRMVFIARLCGWL